MCTLVIFCRTVGANGVGIGLDESIAAESALQAALTALSALPVAEELCWDVNNTKERKASDDEVHEKFMELHEGSLLSAGCSAIPWVHRAGRAAIPCQAVPRHASP